jgi:uncharacterized protein (TIGR00266 family)
MNYTIKHKPSYSLLDIDLDPGESIQAEAGSMVYMSGGVNIQTVLGGGIVTALIRKFFGGETMFYNIYSALDKKIKIGLAPSLSGDIVNLPLNENSVIIQKGSYLCSEPGVTIKTRFGGFRSIIGGEGIFLLNASGTGHLYLSSYGGIIEIDIDGEYILDTGHMVAFETTLNYEIQKTGSWKSTLLSGEGFTMKFNGKGKLWIQTRVPRGFINWLIGLLP